MVFIEILFKKTDAISCSLLDQENNAIFSKSRKHLSEIYEIELKKLYKAIRAISRNFKKFFNYETKIQKIICSELNKTDNNGFFLLIKSINLDKTLIAIFPLSTSHQYAINNFKKTIKILSYFFNEVASLITN
jgi:hypothetical protein